MFPYTVTRIHKLVNPIQSTMNESPPNVTFMIAWDQEQFNRASTSGGVGDVGDITISSCGYRSVSIQALSFRC